MRFLPRLTAHRGKLLSGEDKGQEVLAGSFLRKREIVLDSSLLTDARERARIFLHELFHFAWVRLGNPGRQSWEDLIDAELRSRARGELGWSSEWRKNALAGRRTLPLWPHYLCESFCDTAAWRYSGSIAHDEFTLANRWCRARKAWFDARFGNGRPVRF